MNKKEKKVLEKKKQEKKTACSKEQCHICSFIKKVKNNAEKSPAFKRYEKAKNCIGKQIENYKPKINSGTKNLLSELNKFMTNLGKKIDNWSKSLNKKNKK